MRLAHGEVRPELRLLQHDADALRGTRGPGCCGSWPSTRHLARVARAVALEDLDRRRLAGAVRAEQAEDLALLDLEVDAAHRLERAVRLPQAADGDRASRSVQLDERVPARRERRLGPARERGDRLAAVGLVADDDDRLAAAARRVADVVRRRARREPLVDLRLAEAERGRGLARAQQRARDDRVRLEALARAGAGRARAPARGPRA